MLKAVLVKDKELLVLFSKLFYSFIKVELPIDYLERGMVYLIYNGESIIGGYIIVCVPPFRFMELLPKKIKENDFFLNHYSLDEMYEVNGFFVTDKKFLINILKDMLANLLALNKKYLLAFYDASNKRISNTWQKTFNIKKVYEGKPENSKLKSHQNIFFGYVSQKEIESSYLNIIQRIKKH